MFWLGTCNRVILSFGRGSFKDKNNPLRLCEIGRHTQTQIPTTSTSPGASFHAGVTLLPSTTLASGGTSAAPGGTLAPGMTQAFEGTVNLVATSARSMTSVPDVTWATAVAPAPGVTPTPAVTTGATGNFKLRVRVLFNRNLPSHCHETSLMAFISWIAGMALSMR